MKWCLSVKELHGWDGQGVGPQVGPHLASLVSVSGSGRALSTSDGCVLVCKMQNIKCSLSNRFVFVFVFIAYNHEH